MNLNKSAEDAKGLSDEKFIGFPSGISELLRKFRIAAGN